MRSKRAAKKPLRIETARDKSFLAVAEKLFTTLETFTNFREGELSLDQITRLNGLPKSTSFRLLQSLEKCGFLAQNSETGRYSLGERFFALTNSGLPYQRLISIAKPFLHSLMLTFGESVNLGVYDEGMVAHIFAIDSPKPNPRCVPCSNTPCRPSRRPFAKTCRSVSAVFATGRFRKPSSPRGCC